MLRVQLLGPVEAYADDRPIALGGSKPRALLAALVLAHGNVVSADRLIDILWPQDPPQRARPLIQVYVSTLRGTLAENGFSDVIQTRKPGYVLRLDRASVDVHAFVSVVGEARALIQKDEFQAAARLLDEAIGLWRGPALSGLVDGPLSGEARQLDEMLVSVHEDRFDVELRLGRHDHIAELTGLVTRNPTNERLRGQLMTSLYRAGRQADALARYREGREILVGELGLEPGLELTAVHNAILRGADDMRPSPLVQERPQPRVIPAQIPAAPTDFTGRGAEVACFEAAFGAPVPGVIVVAGPGGSGKSTLAMHVGHRFAASFPDGQLFADLRGTSDSPVPPGEVLGGFLRGLGVDEPVLPKSTQDRVELFRSLLADRHVLVVLDDAADEAQVRALLPGGARCAALITSRYRLAGLSGATLLELDVLSDEQAWHLLGRIVGEPRLAVDPGSAARILSACENLPLAIRIAGARLAIRQQLPLRVLADRLADERQRLDELSAGDLAVRASIELSYRSLDAAAQATLRHLAYFGLPEFSPWVTGWMLDIAQTQAEQLLESLVDAQLVTFVGVDQVGELRYRMHDLVRIYARERAEAQETPEALAAAVAGAIQGWLTVAEDIAVNSPPAESVWRQRTNPRTNLSGAVASTILTDPHGWLRGEEACVAAGVDRAASIGLHQLVSELVQAVIAVERYGANRFDFRSRIITAALEAAERARDMQGEALMLNELGQLRYAQDQYVEARKHFTEALSRFRVMSDVRYQAAALTGLGMCCREPGLLAEAIHFLDQAAALVLALDDGSGIGYVHRLRGSVLLEQGEYAAARADLERSLGAYRQIGSQRGIALTLRTLGMYHRARGEYEAALDACAESTAIFEDCGDELMYSYAVRAHAKVQMRMGHAESALPRLEQALSVSQAYGDRWGQACNLHVLGQLHLSRDRRDLAESCFDAAMSIWDVLETPLWRARTLYASSQLYRACGDEDRAQSALDQALRIFHERGAREYREVKGV